MPPDAVLGPPPREEIERVWAEAIAVHRDAGACRWLRARRISVDQVKQADLARVLPRGLRLPAWAHFRRKPWSSTHRLVLPLYGADGCAESLHARALNLIAEGGRGKGASPAGYALAGLLMASPAGVDMLRGAGRPEEVIVAEGVPDFLAFATTGPAVIGVVAGAWSVAVAARVPSGAKVEIATHRDAAGDEYARTVSGTLKDRCHVVRR